MSDGDDKFAFKDPASLIVKEEKKEWRSQAFQGVSPFDFAMKQKLLEKERKEKERDETTCGICQKVPIKQWFSVAEVVG